MNALRSGALLAIFFAVVGWSGAGSASVVVALELDELVARADHVMVAQVLDQSSRWDHRRRIVTDVRMHVVERLKGSHRSGDEVILVVLGGSVGDVGLMVPGEPGFNDGERVLLFARNSVDGPELRPCGMSQGVMRLDDRDGGTPLVIPGGEGLSLVDDGPAGAWLTTPDSTPSPRPLSDVVQEIRTLIRRQATSPTP